MKKPNITNRVNPEEFITVNREYYDKMKALAELNESAVKCVFDELLSEKIKVIQSEISEIDLKCDIIKTKSNSFNDFFRDILSTSIKNHGYERPYGEIFKLCKKYLQSFQ